MFIIQKFRKLYLLGLTLVLVSTLLPQLASASTTSLQLLNTTPKISKNLNHNTKPDSANSTRHKLISKKAKELEGVFLTVMLEPVFPKGEKTNLYGGGTGSDVFRGLVLDQYGQILSKSGGIGLAKSVEKQLIPPGTKVP